MSLPFDAVQDRYKRAQFSRAAHKHSDWHPSSVTTELSSALGHFSLHFFSLLFHGFAFLESTLIAHFSFLTKKRKITQIQYFIGVLHSAGILQL